MNTFKKYLSVLLSVVMLLSMVPVMAAENNTLTADTVTAYAGDTVTVKVMLENVTGIGNMEFIVAYDETRLDLESFTENGIFTAGEMPEDDEYAGVSLAFSDTKNYTASEEMLSMNFKVLDNAPIGDAAITIIPGDGTQFYYEGRTEVDFDFDLVHGKVTVLAKDFTAVPFLKLADEQIGETASLTYDGTSRAVTVANYDDGASVAYYLNGTEVTAIDVKDAGTYPVKAVISKEGYNTVELTSTITVNAKDVAITGLAADDKEYDGDVSTSFVKTNAKIDGAVEGDDVSIKYGTDPVFADANVGEDKAVTFGALSLTGEDAANYTLTAQPVLTADITPLEISVIADAKQKTVGTSDPALTYTYSPALVAGDSFTGALTREAGEDEDEYAILQGTLDLSDNYTIVYTEGVFTIVDKEYTRIEVATPPTDTDYIEGQSFDPAGLTINAYYDDVVEGEKYDVIDGADCTFDPTAFAAGDTSVTVGFAGHTTTVAVTVAPKALASISFEIDPSETSFKVGKTFTRDTLKVYGTYNNGVDVDVELTEGKDYTVDDTAVNTAVPSTYKVVITPVTELASLSYDVEVVEKALTKIEITGSAKANYIANGEQAFDPTGLTITAYYDNDTTEDVTASAAYAPTGALTVEDTKITYTYTFGGVTKTADYAIAVSPKEVSGLEVLTPATKTEYIENTAFEPAGTVVKIHYNDGDSEEVSADYAAKGITFAPATVKLGTTAVTVSLGKWSDTMAVTVKAKTIVSLEITAYEAEAVDGDAAVISTVTATYDNGETGTVTGYTVSPAVLALADPAVEETFDVTVSLNGITSDAVAVKVVPCGAENATTGERYPSLDDALADAKDGETVVVKEDTTVDKDVEVDGDVTLDTNGKNVTTAEDASINTGNDDSITVDNTKGTADVVLTINGEEVTIAAGETYTDDGEEEVSHNYELMFAMAKTYHENFVFEITVEQAEGGTVKARSLARIGEDVTVTVTAEEGYEIADVLVDGESVGAVKKYIIEDVADDVTVTAVFEKID